MAIRIDKKKATAAEKLAADLGSKLKELGDKLSSLNKEESVRKIVKAHSALNNGDGLSIRVPKRNSPTYIYLENESTKTHLMRDTTEEERYGQRDPDYATKLSAEEFIQHLGIKSVADIEKIESYIGRQIELVADRLHTRNK